MNDNSGTSLSLEVEKTAPKKKTIKKFIIAAISVLASFALISAILLGTVFAPFGHYLSARWNILINNYDAAYSHLNKMDKPVFNSEELLKGFSTEPAVTRSFGSNGNLSSENINTYDNRGRLIKAESNTARDAVYYTYTYNNEGKLIEKSFYYNGSLSESIIRKYDKHDNVELYEYKRAGLLMFSISLDYTYKGSAPTAAKVKILKGENEYLAELTFKHDSKGYLTEITYKGDRSVIGYFSTAGECEAKFTFTYDKRHFLSECVIREDFTYTSEYSQKASTITREVKNTYENGRITSHTDGKISSSSNSGGNGIKEEYRYDERGNLVREIKYDSSLGETTVYEYTYDENNHLILKQELDKYDSVKRSEKYTNDKYGNPIRTDHSISYSGEKYSETAEYKYDKGGNILEKSRTIEENSQTTHGTYITKYENWKVRYSPADKKKVFEYYGFDKYINYIVH